MHNRNRDANHVQGYGVGCREWVLRPAPSFFIRPLPSKGRGIGTGLGIRFMGLWDIEFKV